MFPYLTFSQTKAATINYFGSPQATYISIIFNKSGTAKDIKIIRKNAKRQQYGGSIKGFVLDEQALLNHFDVEKLSIKLSRYLYHSLGFSSRGYVNIK